ncbi:cellulose binding domain-containing protein [Plantactinospora solaniradicis]|uniref:Cellulose binding domain-containing protein n=1 Tax=Plantactinospora solaniradicis TaxID=1723736 RepID=A0ABW1KDH6_9ACTN
MRSRPSGPLRWWARFLSVPVLAIALTATAGHAGYAAEAEDTEPPSVPGQVTMVDYGPDGVLLTWAPSTDNVAVTSYHVSQQVSDVVTIRITSTNSIGIPAAPSRTYPFSVRAVDAAMNMSSWAPSVRLTMPPGDSEPPTTPSGLRVGTVGETGVGLGWGASTDDIVLTGYEVLSVTPTGNTVVARTVAYPPFYPVPATSVSVNGLTPRTTYTFAVRAVDEAGNHSALSDLVTVTTGPVLEPPPTCAVRYRSAAQWQGGRRAELLIGNLSPTTVTGWTLTWSFPSSRRIVAVWGGVLVGHTDGVVTVRNARHNATIRPGGTVTIGYAANGSASPTGFELNGQSCQARIAPDRSGA